MPNKSMTYSTHEQPVSNFVMKGFAGLGCLFTRGTTTNTD